jgi:hypothetical protein
LTLPDYAIDIDDITPLALSFMIFSFLSFMMVFCRCPPPLPPFLPPFRLADCFLSFRLFFLHIFSAFDIDIDNSHTAAQPRHFR